MPHKAMSDKAINNENVGNEDVDVNNIDENDINESDIKGKDVDEKDNSHKLDSTTLTAANLKSKGETESQKQLQTNLQKQLRSYWLLWLIYRGVIFSVLLNVFLATSPNIVGGIAWQLMLLIPALILTPWMLKGRSPYALLMGSMITLIYLGASGVTLFTIFYGSGITVWWIYALDTALILIINVGMFRLLKILPSMNKRIED